MFAERMRVHEGRVTMRAYLLCERAAEFLELRPGDPGRGVLEMCIRDRRVCKAHAPARAHRALRTLNPAKPQEVRFC